MPLVGGKERGLLEMAMMPLGVVVLVVHDELGGEIDGVKRFIQDQDI